MECNICGENVEGIATGLIIVEVEPDGDVNVDDEVGGAMHDKCYANFERSARVAPELLEALETVVAEVLAGVAVTLPMSVIAKAKESV